MRKRLLGCLIVGAAFIGALALTDPVTAAGGATCATKNCPKNTRCCYSCTGNPICVKAPSPCPECAPQ